MSAASLYRTVWRWHFYAGLFVLPFVAVLALSGTFFLFKPQIERWEERAFQHLPVANAVSASKHVEAALAVFAGARFHSYRLPERPGDAAMVHLALPEHGAMRDVFVSPQGSVLGSMSPDTRLINFVRRIHGQLLLGARGSWLVELASSWTIVLIVTGLYLWWPRGRGLAGVVWPRRGTPLRDLHAVTGFWVSGFALVLLATGLPWTDVWGSAFKTVRNEMGWVNGAQDWTIGGRTTENSTTAEGEHGGHDQGAMHAASGIAAPALDAAALDTLVARAAALPLAFPVLVAAPDPAGAGPAGIWTVKSDAQNRPLRMTIRYDADGSELSRERFSDRHPIDQVIGYGIAWHEGQLVGVINQVIGVATTVALLTLCVVGFMLWRRRRPQGSLGATPLPSDARKPLFIAIATLALALLLPLLAASLLLLWLFELALPCLSPAAAAWLGLTSSSRTSTH